jgi:uncharacterized protein (DUF2384 family)
VNDRRPIRQRLADWYTEADIDRWLYGPHPELGGRWPAHAVDQGDAESVHRVIDRLDDGVYR